MKVQGVYTAWGQSLIVEETDPLDCPGSVHVRQVRQPVRID